MDSLPIISNKVNAWHGPGGRGLGRGFLGLMAAFLICHGVQNPAARADANGFESAVSQAAGNRSYVDSLRKEPSMRLFREWLLGQQAPVKDFTKLFFLRQAFMIHFSNDPVNASPEAYGIFMATLENRRLSIDRRGDIADALAHTNTIAAARALCDALNSPGNEPGFRPSLLKAIPLLGYHHWRNPFDDTSAVLEQAFASAQLRNDADASAALATAILRIGTPAGVRAVANFASENAADGYSKMVDNDKSVDVLKGIFWNSVQSDGSGTHQKGMLLFSAGNLLQIGTSEAIQPVLEWLGKTDSVDDSTVESLFSGLDEGSETKISAYLEEHAFRNEAVKRRILAILASDEPTVIEYTKK